MIEGGDGGDDVLYRIESSLLVDTLGEDGGLGDVKLQVSIFLKDTFQITQNLKSHVQLGLDVTIIDIRNR